jgi:hypothetical protein
MRNFPPYTNSAKTYYDNIAGLDDMMGVREWDEGRHFEREVNMVERQGNGRNWTDNDKVGVASVCVERKEEAIVVVVKKVDGRKQEEEEEVKGKVKNMVKDLEEQIVGVGKL